jgi:predicted RNase H-like nuclease
VTVGCTLPALIEVYPHTALLSLLKCKERFKYKISKARKFFKSGDPIAGLLEAFQTIHSGLSREIADLPPFLPARDDVKSVASLKRYEDALDALICAWVGTLFVNTKAIPLGDGNAAIWCPEDVT